MKTIWKIVIICIAAGLLLCTLGIFLGASLSGLHLDETGIHLAGAYETIIAEHDLEPFKDIIVDVRYGDVEFIAADKFGIDIIGSNKKSWAWELNNGTLKITQEDNGTTFFVFGFGLIGKTLVKIYIPASADLGAVSIHAGSGDINISSLNAGNTQINNSYGDINISGLISDDLQIELSSGDFVGTDLSCDNISFTNSYGDGRFEGISVHNFAATIEAGDFTLKNCGADDIHIKNSYGEIIADNISSLNTTVLSGSGNINLKGEFLGKTVINASYGDIKFSTTKEEEFYDYDISVAFGDLIFGSGRQTNNTAVKNSGLCENKLEVSSTAGDVTVYFIK